MAFSLCIGAVVAAPGAGRGEGFSVFVIRASAATAIGSLRMEGSNAGEALLPTRLFRARFRRALRHITQCYGEVTNCYSRYSAFGSLFFQIPWRADIVAHPGVEYFRLNIFHKNWRRTDARSLATGKPARSVAAHRARRRHRHERRRQDRRME